MTDVIPSENRPAFPFYVVRRGSMSPAFEDGHQLLVSARAVSRPGPSRGDVVVVVFDQDGAGRRDLKRVVGLPGEELSILDGALLINGVPLSEPYLGGLPASLGLGEAAWRLGPAQYFVMGDSRAHSTDSRSLGPVPADHILGRAWFRYWPVSRWGRIARVRY